ncbi:hypothetical protein [Jeotgalibaca arthritidis]|uniref:Bacterial Pleckstrin homology domain-containing protein n=1 Tax=Jeotgalibaca arthritidis TaxID=1868794 RepID=A0A6G7KA22_9LACT|nr:hypothetical protein [Jeotgalibaca arthritidis]QII82113.1 hypothetical protein G7057_06485 [Jeotgalibaca arthritidis]
MENKISIKNNNLIILPQGLDKVWSLKNKLEIPMTNVMGATIDKNILDVKKGFRGPGLEIPNKWSGTWTLNGEKIFWNVTRKETPVVIQLKNEKFSRLILGLDDAIEWVDEINNSINTKHYELG